MSMFHTGMALFLLLTMTAGLVRILRGPTRADRMMTAQLFGTTGVAVFLLLAEGMAEPALHDAALVLALLSGLAVVAFVRCANPRLEKRGEEEP